MVTYLNEHLDHARFSQFRRLRGSENEKWFLNGKVLRVAAPTASVDVPEKSKWLMSIFCQSINCNKRREEEARLRSSPGSLGTSAAVLWPKVRAAASSHQVKATLSFHSTVHYKSLRLGQIYWLDEYEKKQIERQILTSRRKCVLTR